MVPLDEVSGQGHPAGHSSPELPPLRRHRHRWQHWSVLAACFAGAFIIALTPVSDGDIFWHVAAGREMVARRDWLRADPFTISAAGRPWIDVHWLFQLVAYSVYRAFGLAGLVIAKAVAVATGAVVLVRLPQMTTGRPTDAAAGGERRHSGAVGLCAVALLAALFLARHQLAPRPTVVTLVMLALFLSVLESARGGARRVLLWLPVLQLVWANCQGLSALGPALVAAYLAGACLARSAMGRRADRSPLAADDGELPRRELAWALALCCLALLITPYGWQAVRLPAELLRRVTPTAGNVFSAEIAENLTPWALARLAPDETAHLWWYLAALAVCLAVAGRRLSLSRCLSRFFVLGGFVTLALMANRNVLLLYWVATPVAASALAASLGVRWAGASLSPPRRWWRVGARAFGDRAAAVGAVASTTVLPGALAALLALALIARHREGELDAPAAFHFPVESVKQLKGLGASGAIFAPDHQGGFIELTMPALKPYLDTRLVLHTSDEYAAYLAAVDDPARFDALDARESFQYVVLTTTYSDRYLGLVQHLAFSPRWKLIFTDGSEVLFARDGAALDLEARPVTAALLSALADRFGATPQVHEAARLNLARFLIVLNETREAQFVLQTVDSRAATQLRARSHFVAGERAAAESLARTLLASDARDLRSLTLLARLAIAVGDRSGGAGWLRQALQVDPYDAEARQVLEQLDPAGQPAVTRR